MGIKKPVLPYFVFAVVPLLFLIVSSNDTLFGQSGNWKLMGETKDKNYSVYYDTASVKQVTASNIRLRLKKELSEAGVIKFSKDYYASLKEAEDKAESKIQGSPEELLKVLIKRQTKEYDVEIDCVKNEWRVPSGKGGAMQFVVVDPIEQGTVIERIKKEICR